MQCKKALEEAGGDVEKAKVILRKASAAIAAKKADRELGSGVAAAYVHAGGAVIGAIVLACESDFVAKNPEFSKLAYDIAMHVAAMNPKFIKKDDVKDADVAAAKAVFQDEAKDRPKEMQAKIVQGKLDAFLADKILMDQPFVKNGELTIQKLIDQHVQKFGEKMQVVRMERLSVK